MTRPRGYPKDMCAKPPCDTMEVYRYQILEVYRGEIKEVGKDVASGRLEGPANGPGSQSGSRPRRSVNGASSSSCSVRSCPISAASNSSEKAPPYTRNAVAPAE